MPLCNLVSILLATNININNLWALKERSKDGDVLVDEKKFPNGLKHLSDYIHSKGRKIGIKSYPVIYTCGGQGGSLGYEEIDVADYEKWGSTTSNMITATAKESRQ